MAFQRPKTFPKSIYENASYGLRVNGVMETVPFLIYSRICDSMERHDRYLKYLKYLRSILKENDIQLANSIFAMDILADGINSNRPFIVKENPRNNGSRRLNLP